MPRAHEHDPAPTVEDGITWGHGYIRDRYGDNPDQARHCHASAGRDRLHPDDDLAALDFTDVREWAVSGMPGGRLSIREGRVTGPAHITYNDPFPTPAGRWGSGSISGLVLHTMVGNLPGTIVEFNNPANGASAHFGIDQAGRIHQFGPIGEGWIAWAEADGNATWYSVENADDGNPDNPLTDAQITANAQLLEVLAGFAGFPLQEANSPSEHGFGVHYMGGAAWGGHTCPDLPPEHVRSRERPAIIARARAIRAGTYPPAPVEDDMIFGPIHVLTGANADDAIPLPPGINRVRLESVAATSVSVQFHGHDVTKGYKRGWTEPYDPMKVPSGCHLLRVWRDPDGNPDVPLTLIGWSA